MMELWLVRHGETDWNRERRLQGWTDVPLNETGHLQARLLARRLEGIPFAHIYSSDLERALKTAEVLQQVIGVPLSIDQRLRERRFGTEEGMVRTDRSDRTARPQNSLTPNDTKEPRHEVTARIQEYLTEVASTHGTGRVLAVTHGGLIRIALSIFGFPTSNPMHNTGVSRLQYDGANWHVLAVNASDHLESLSESAGA